MQYVLTIIAPDGNDQLTDVLAASLRHALDGLGAETAKPDWLASNKAVDIAFDGLDPDQAQAAVAKTCTDLELDAVAQPSQNRKKKILVADMDSTIVTSETLDELAAFAGIKDKIAGITKRAMNGEIGFKEALRERVGMLKGLSAATLQQTMDETEITKGAEALVRTMTANGAYCALVSGGFDFFTTRVAKKLGFDESRGNRLEIEDGILTGKVLDPIINKDAKLEALMEIASEKCIPLTHTMTVGDGANDLPMIQAAGLGVAYHAKPVVAQAARAQVNFGDLTNLLFLQGYRLDEIVRG